MSEDEKNDHSSLPEATSYWAIRPYPDLIDTSKIEADGGKWIRLDDGRIVEYFVSGSSSPDAKILVDCPGGNCTAQLFPSFLSWTDMAKALNYKVISVSYAGFGYSSIQPGRKIKDWPVKDLLPILQKEKVTEFVAIGASFGTPHALAAAWAFANKNKEHENFGITCLGLGLRVPFMGSESCKTLGLKNHFDVAFTSTSANTSFLGYITAKLFTVFAGKPGDAFKAPGPFMKAFVNLLNPGSLDKLENLMNSHTEMMETLKADMVRCVVHSDQGILYNYATDTLIDHGYDVTEIKPDIPICVWYAEDDEDCPPSHGMWIAGKGSEDNHHFTNVASRAFDDQGHLGTAFLNHDEFLTAFHKHMNP